MNSDRKVGWTRPEGADIRNTTNKGIRKMNWTGRLIWDMLTQELGRNPTQEEFEAAVYGLLNQTGEMNVVN